jgi:hypothetical protein
MGVREGERGGRLGLPDDVRLVLIGVLLAACCPHVVRIKRFLSGIPGLA